MTIARKYIVNPNEVGWYHCVSRCVRRAFLCGNDKEHRRQWVADRLKVLAQCFAVDVAAYAVMANHLHIVVKIDPLAPQTWSAQEVAEKWLTVFPVEKPAAGGEVVVAPSRKLVERFAKEAGWVAIRRKRLGDLGWFMKSLKEPISRRANREDGCTGAFWEGRFRSTALLDEAAVIACMAYVDLNPVRAKIAATPEDSAYTSAQDRIHARQYVEAQRGLRKEAPERARALFAGIDAGRDPKHAEDGLWLWRFSEADGTRKWGCLSQDEYLAIVDGTGRMLRSGKRGRIAPELAGILGRLDLDAEAWIATMVTGGRQMSGTGLGHVTARAVEAKRRKISWVSNKCLLFMGKRAAAA
jgi:REP element-mobilizing transposase RayT